MAQPASDGRTRILVAMAALAFAVVACALAAEWLRNEATEAVPDRFAPRSFAVIEGDGFLAIPGRGKSPMIVNVWATWCGPCRREMQSLERLHHILEGSDVHIVGISVDTDRNLAREFVRRERLTFPNAIDERSQLSSEVVKYPTTFVISADGRVLARTEAARDWSDTVTIAWLESMLGRRIHGAGA